MFVLDLICSREEDWDKELIEEGWSQYITLDVPHKQTIKTGKWQNQRTSPS